MRLVPRKKGISFVEMVISIAILAVITVMTIGGLNEYRKQQALEKSAALMSSVLERARSKTLTNENSTIHSVRINEERLILFPGVFASTSSDNEYFSFDPLVELGSVNLTNGTNTISYRKISGQALATGTVQVRLRKEPAITKSITVYSSGLIETQ